MKKKKRRQDKKKSVVGWDKIRCDKRKERGGR